jgi:anti-sigma B factor antagonist
VLFDVQVRDRGGWVVVALVGELDLASAPEVRTAVVRALADGGAHLVLDLSGVDFVDSLGLGVVVSALKRVRGRGGELAVVVSEERVRRPFTLTGLDSLVPLYDSVDEVVAVAGAVDG